MTTLLGYTIIACIIALLVDTVKNKMSSKMIHNIKTAAIVGGILLVVYIVFKIYRKIFTKQLDSTNRCKSEPNPVSSLFTIFYFKKNVQKVKESVQKEIDFSIPENNFTQADIETFISEDDIIQTDIETAILEDDISQTEQQYTYDSQKETLIVNKYKKDNELLRFAKCASQIANLESLKELTENHCKEQSEYIMCFYNEIKDFDILIIQTFFLFKVTK